MTLIILLFFFLLFNVDKQILSLVANMLYDELGFTDTQLGLLGGFVYSIPYSIGVFVIGWLVDRFSRRAILFTGVLFWSLAAAGSGLATSFATMAMARAGVGLGEAALMPAALPLIAAVFPRDKVSGAIGFFYVGSNLGAIIANVLGGVTIDAFVSMGNIDVPILGTLEPWQAVFVATGLPGVVFAFLAWGLAKTKTTGKTDADMAVATRLETLGEYIRRHWLFLATFTVGTASITLCSYTLISWAAPYYGRTYDWNHATIGLIAAMGLGVGVVGNPLWGMLADRLRRRGHIDGVYRVFIPLVLFGIPLAAIAFLTRNPVISVVAFILSNFAINSQGSTFSALQLASPPHLRGRLTGIKLVVQGVVGLGIGPVLAGFFAEHVFKSRDMLGPAILCSISLAAVTASGLLALGRTSYIRAVREQEPA